MTVAVTEAASDLLRRGRLADESGSPEEAIRLFGEAAKSDDPEIVTEALRRMSSVLYRLSRWERAFAVVRESRERALAAGLPHRVEEAYLAEANVYLNLQDYDNAARLYRIVLASGISPLQVGFAEQNLGTIAAIQKRFDAVDGHLQRALACFTEIGYLKGRLFVLNNHGCVQMDAGAPHEALPLFDQARELACKHVDSYMFGLATVNRGKAYLLLGQYTHAIRDLGEAPYYFRSRTHRKHRMAAFSHMGDALHAIGDSQANNWYRKALALAIDLDLHAKQAELRDKIIGERTDWDSSAWLG